MIRRAAIICLVAAGAFRAYGHGTEHTLLSGGVIGIRASYETGEPMAKARVLVFAPGETEVTFETGTDPNGVVCLAPDRPGTWILQVRDEGGHGMRINLEVDEKMMGRLEEASSGFSTLQKILMALCVAWGFAGTALFFRRTSGRAVDRGG